MSETKSPGSCAFLSGVKSVNTIRVPGHEIAQDLRDLEKRGSVVVADVQHLADRRGLAGRGDESVDAVVDVEEVPENPAASRRSGWARR